MTERIRDERFFEITGLDTSDPDWQIKSLSDIGLQGFIIDANQRMGVISPYKVLTQRANEIEKRKFSDPILKSIEFNGLINLVSKSLHMAKDSLASGPEQTSGITDSQERNQNLVSGWIRVNEEKGIPPLQLGTCEAFLSASSSFRWAKDARSLGRLSDSVAILNSAYQEMGRRGIK